MYQIKVEEDKKPFEIEVAESLGSSIKEAAEGMRFLVMAGLTAEQAFAALPPILNYHYGTESTFDDEVFNTTISCMPNWIRGR